MQISPARSIHPPTRRAKGNSGSGKEAVRAAMVSACRQSLLAT